MQDNIFFELKLNTIKVNLQFLLPWFSFLSLLNHLSSFACLIFHSSSVDWTLSLICCVFLLISPLLSQSFLLFTVGYISPSVFSFSLSLIVRHHSILISISLAVETCARLPRRFEINTRGRVGSCLINGGKTGSGLESEELFFGFWGFFLFACILDFGWSEIRKLQRSCRVFVTRPAVKLHSHFNLTSWQVDSTNNYLFTFMCAFVCVYNKRRESNSRCSREEQTSPPNHKLSGAHMENVGEGKNAWQMAAQVTRSSKRWWYKYFVTVHKEMCQVSLH